MCKIWGLGFCDLGSDLIQDPSGLPEPVSAGLVDPGPSSGILNDFPSLILAAPGVVWG